MARSAISRADSPSTVDQGARRGERERAAGADADQPVLRLQHVAVAGQHQRHGFVGDRHHRLEPAQVAVGAPVLGQLDAGARQLAGMLLELGLEPLEQGEGVGGGAGEAGDHAAAGQPPHLLRVRLHDRLAEADLAVAGDDDLAVLAHGKNGRAVPNGRFVAGGHWLSGGSARAGLAAGFKGSRAADQGSASGRGADLSAPSPRFLRHRRKERRWRERQ